MEIERKCMQQQPSMAPSRFGREGVNLREAAPPPPDAVLPILHGRKGRGMSIVGKKEQEEGMKGKVKWW